MSVFSINIVRTKGIASEHQTIINRLYNAEHTISHIQNRIVLGTNTLAVKNAIKNIRNEIKSAESGARNLKKGLESVNSVYEATENKLSNVEGVHGGNIGIEADIAADEVKSVLEQFIEENFTWKNLWKMVGKAGVVGSGISAFGKFIVSDKKGSDWSKLVSDFWKTGFKVGKSIKKVKKEGLSASWKSFFGLDSGSLGKIASSNLGTSAKAYHGAASVWKNTLREFKTADGMAKQIGGIALSAVTNSFMNYEEFKEKFNNGDASKEYAIGRGVAEVVCETAVDWGKNIAIGAGVAVAFAAAGVAAPAVAVGAATVAVSVAADWACKKITGALTGEEKGLTETVSDLVLDVGEGIIKNVSEGAGAVWSGLKNGWKNMTSGWKLSFG